jgi:hypothetical protein
VHTELYLDQVTAQTGQILAVVRPFEFVEVLQRDDLVALDDVLKVPLHDLVRMLGVIV